MLCQSIKREQWVDKLKSKLLKVPYTHMVFTLPHQFNGLARRNEKVFYGLMMRVSWMTASAMMKGTKMGMTSVLHTFGSDMKYHIHVHALVTFGGLDTNGDWQFPSCKYALAKYRVLCSTFKNIFIQELQKEVQKQKVYYHLDIQDVIKESEKIRWVVHSTYPTMQTQTIEDYLAKYINRVGVTNNRLSYLKEKQIVQLQYNDYKNQELNKAAPKAYKNLEPLVAMNQILQHVLPPYFQKSRHHGLHSANEKTKASIPDKILKNASSIRTVFEILSHLLSLRPFTCDQCQSNEFEIEELSPVRPKNNTMPVHQSSRAPPRQNSIPSIQHKFEYQFSKKASMQTY